MAEEEEGLASDRRFRQFRAVRQVIIFCLGIAIIIDGIFGTTTLPVLVIGLVLLGLIPVEDVLRKQ